MLTRTVLALTPVVQQSRAGTQVVDGVSMETSMLLTCFSVYI